MIEDAAKAIAVRCVEEEAAAGSVVIKRFRRVGNRAVVAAEFISARTGRPRRAFAGVVLRDDRWRPSGGWSSNVVQQAAADETWRNSGGWSNEDWAVHGGWVADVSATQFRAVDRTGRGEHDTLRDGIAILIWEGHLDADTRGELLDADGEVLRSGLVLRRRPSIR